MFYGAARKAQVDLLARQAMTVTVALVRVIDGAVVAVWPVALLPETVSSVIWDGMTAGVAQPAGRYEFRVLAGAPRGDAASSPPRRRSRWRPARSISSITSSPCAGATPTAPGSPRSGPAAAATVTRARTCSPAAARRCSPRAAASSSSTAPSARPATTSSSTATGRTSTTPTCICRRRRRWPRAPACSPARRSATSATPATPRLPPALRDLDRARLVHGGALVDPLPFLKAWDAYS